MSSDVTSSSFSGSSTSNASGALLWHDFTKVLTVPNMASKARELKSKRLLALLICTEKNL